MTTRISCGRKVGGRSFSPVIGSCRQQLTAEAKQEMASLRRQKYLAAVARWELDAWKRLQQEMPS